jgi:pyridoxine kinase
MPDPVILSISSQVAYGHVGNAAIVPALNALGFEVLAVPTVLLAHHPGHGAPAGRALEPAETAALVEGLDKVGAFGPAVGMLSGYLGHPGTADTVADAARRLKGTNPRALYLCDPVLGDAGRVYVRDGVEAGVRDRLLPLADAITPNHFELERLAGASVTTLDAAIAAARSLIARGPKLVVVTSLKREGAEAQAVETLAVTADGAWLAATPKLDPVPQGSGDLLAGLLLGHLAHGAAALNALARAVSAVDVVLQASRGQREMRLIASLAQLRAPPPLSVRRVG